MLNKTTGILFIQALTGYKIDVSPLGQLGADYINVASVAVFALPVVVENEHPFESVFPNTYNIDDSDHLSETQLKLQVFTPAQAYMTANSLAVYVDRIADTSRSASAPILCSNCTEEDVLLGPFSDESSIKVILKKGGNVIHVVKSP